MDIASLENCQTCFRPNRVDGNSSSTQWVTVCRCDKPYSPSAQFSIDVCGNCRRRIAANANGAVTRQDLCTCGNPNAQKISTHLKQGEKDPVALNVSSIGLAPESFPEERYAPIAFLGDSPRATVFLARDKQRGTKVAVKCFKRVQPSMQSTFQSEVKKNQQLTHTSIAKVVDSGFHNGKSPYVVTEYKDGFNVEQCAELYGAPSYDVVVKILMGICESSAYAQKQGVLHRDLKPGNVIFLDDLNSEPTVILTDFALPKVMFAEVPQTPWDAMFMSADEARNLDYSEKSEVYSVGAVGYAIVAARPPFSEGTFQEIKNSQGLKLPPRMSNLKFDKKRPSELDEIIERCMEKDPKDRFETVVKLSERLEVFPRRVQMQIDRILAERRTKKIMKFAAIGGAIVAVIGVALAVVHPH